MLHSLDYIWQLLLVSVVFSVK